MTYWYNYCFSKAVVRNDNHNHNHNHKCFQCLFIYLFIYLSTQRTPCKYGPVGLHHPQHQAPVPKSVTEEQVGDPLTVSLYMLQIPQGWVTLQDVVHHSPIP